MQRTSCTFLYRVVICYIEQVGGLTPKDFKTLHMLHNRRGGPQSKFELDSNFMSIRLCDKPWKVIKSSGPSYWERKEAHSHLAQEFIVKLLSWQLSSSLRCLTSPYKCHVSACMYTQVFSPWWSHSSSTFSKASGASSLTFQILSD